MVPLSVLSALTCWLLTRSFFHLHAFICTVKSNHHSHHLTHELLQNRQMLYIPILSICAFRLNCQRGVYACAGELAANCS